MSLFSHFLVTFESLTKKGENLFLVSLSQIHDFFSLGL